MVNIVSFNFRILIFVILILRSIIRLFGAGREIQKFSRVMRNIASGKRAKQIGSKWVASF